MAQYTFDHVGRMRQIKAMLDDSSEAADVVQHKQDVLEELVEIVDNIDFAKGTEIPFTELRSCQVLNEQATCRHHGMPMSCMQSLPTARLQISM